jgi:UBX domain
VKGVISYTPSVDGQPRTQILSLLGTPPPTPDAHVANAVEAANATGVDALADGGATPDVATGLPHRITLDRSVPVPTPITPTTPSSEASGHDDPIPLGDDGIIESSGDQNPVSPPPPNPIVSTEGSRQPASEAPKPTPQQFWTRMQRERERQQREERERIRAQIRHDHAERRRLDDLRRQPAIDLTAHTSSNSVYVNPKHSSSSDIGVQVRTFDGKALRSTFPKDATISAQIRPWIDSDAAQITPYSLKIILTPRPNRTIEAAEEEKCLEDLDIIGSCTLVMVPVKGFVESYAPSTSGIVGSAVVGGYNLLSGSIGAVFGGVRSVLRFGQTTPEPQTPSTPEETSSRVPTGQARVRTLADQRIEAQKKEQQFYNGNQLNFEPRKDDEDNKED